LKHRVYLFIYSFIICLSISLLIYFESSSILEGIADVVFKFLKPVSSNKTRKVPTSCHFIPKTKRSALSTSSELGTHHYHFSIQKSEFYQTFSELHLISSNWDQAKYAFLF